MSGGRSMTLSEGLNTLGVAGGGDAEAAQLDAANAKPGSPGAASGASISGKNRSQSMTNLTDHLNMPPDAGFATALEDLFPRAVPETVFIQHMTEVLNKHGYTDKTSINLVSTCRDELCRPFTEDLDRRWTHHFDIGSLAGFIFCGRTGFKAAFAHAPVVQGKERYVFWVAPHIAVAEDGLVGKCMRVGRTAPSSACGALLGILSEIKAGQVALKMDPNDVEYSLAKQEIIGQLPYGNKPSLVELTYAAYECIVDEVRQTAKAAVNVDTCEYVIVSGIQVHGPDGQNYFWPGGMVRYVNGQETDLYEDYAGSVADWHLSLQGWSSAEALMLLQKRRREARLAAKEGDLTKLTRIGLKLESVRDNHKRTLLHVAAKFGQTEVVEYLLKEFKQHLVGQQDIDHFTAMDYAVAEKHDDVAQLIKDAGGGLTGEMLRKGLTLAVRDLNLEEFGRFVKFAKNQEEALQATDSDGRSLVHIAVAIKEMQADRIRKQEQLINNLLGLGADTSSVDNFGNDILHGVGDTPERQNIYRQISSASFDGKTPMSLQSGSGSTGGDSPSYNLTSQASWGSTMDEPSKSGSTPVASSPKKSSLQQVDEEAAAAGGERPPRPPKAYPFSDESWE